jgi:hypothetical protein
MFKARDVFAAQVLSRQVSSCATIWRDGKTAVQRISAPIPGVASVGGSFSHPLYVILLVSRVDRIRKIRRSLSYSLDCTAPPPLADLRVSVGEGKAVGVVLMRSRQVASGSAFSRVGRCAHGIGSRKDTCVESRI